ncbi:hypothetical protein B9Q03_01520 [Candidatus Marsarchaeota G2 archaeon OSP_D]|jgi:hypothetical protein|uniref:Archaeal Type IV pilin N-terminal domain-containing protein n=4 Tax=Candidatus Marsarchaeota group 2 TaxID=2203771 RepID=A0A2R6C7N6_9ARCH|nr:MAG: hypothetical protein B9Q08_02570 [Candidatus Marsarchaeota G2 archaeon ECH_B_SAG-M15]PSN92336.1 MAG: hypothetical protein B9Q03_01520 [Candidatus Marsarchaeota G2 archaeon OSP_D]PSO06776.1 MAG: hypothetical protein B9Q04_14325 [Candidatus Marsarchaeota G2 archaeon BE_D]
MITMFKKTLNKKGVSQSLEAIILIVVALSVVAVYAGWAFGVFGRTISTPILTTMSTPVIQGASTSNPQLYISIKNSGGAAATITSVYVDNQLFNLQSQLILQPGQAETLIVPLGGSLGNLQIGSTVSVVVNAGQTTLSTMALVQS